MSNPPNIHETCATCYSELIMLDTPSETMQQMSEGYTEMMEVCYSLDIDIESLDISFGLCSDCLQCYVISSQISIGGTIDSINYE